MCVCVCVCVCVCARARLRALASVCAWGKTEEVKTGGCYAGWYFQVYVRVRLLKRESTRNEEGGAGGGGVCKRPPNTPSVHHSLPMRALEAKTLGDVFVQSYWVYGLHSIMGDVFVQSF